MVGSLTTVAAKVQASHIGLEQIEAASEVLDGQIVRRLGWTRGETALRNLPPVSSLVFGA